MASIPVTIQGTMFYTDVGVGGGPMPGGPPLGFWGGRPPPYVDIGGPGPQPPSGAHPSHPWVPPLGFWGGTAPPYVDIGGPGPQPPPLGFWGGRPPNYVDIGGPGPQPHPSHPWVPPQAPVIDPDDPTKGYLVAYMPKSDGSGYERITFLVEIPPPTVPTEPQPKA